nr:hypothetical protein [Tanacetum cinerariifolium]
LVNIYKRRKKKAAKARYRKISICYDDDDDEDYTIAITPKEPDNSLSVGAEHLDTIPAMESDEFIKSSFEKLVLNPSESEGEYEYILKEIYLNPLFDEEIISMKIDLHHFNAESDLIKSLLNHDSLIISYSSKSDSLFDEFVGELTLLKSIPLGINETDCDLEEETHPIKRLLYDNSSPRPPKEFFLKILILHLNLSSFPIPAEDSDSFMDEIDLSFTPDDLMPPGMRKMTMNLKGIFLSLKNCLAMIPFHFLKMSHFILICLYPLVLLQNHRMGHKAFQPSTEYSMMIYGRNVPILDVPFLHFYPP